MSAIFPLISILLPFHNEAETLDECLRSIQGQTFTDFELLAVDDSSTDESSSIIQKQALRDPRIRLLRSPARGLVPALNYGLAQANSPLIARMDADDLMYPDRLQRQYDFLQAHPEIDMIGACARLFPESEIDAGYREYIRWQNLCLSPEDISADIYVESPFAHPTVMFLAGVFSGPTYSSHSLPGRENLSASSRRIALTIRLPPGETPKSSIIEYSNDTSPIGDRQLL